MHSGIFNMLRDSVGKHLTAVGYSIELDFLAPVHELADNHRMLLGDVRGKRKEMAELLRIIAYVHRRA